jgi:CRISPR-associated endonuclease Csn1
MEKSTKLKLGLDIGVNSIGWFLLLFKDNSILKIIDRGVFILPSARNNKWESNAVERTVKRGCRRNLKRQKNRKKALIDILKKNSLFPLLETEAIEMKKWDVYKLRNKAVVEKVSLYELGRILVHINQRRGFQSNRKDNNRDKESGNQCKAIKALEESLQAKTLGQHLYKRKLDGHDTRFRPNPCGNNKVEWEIFPTRAIIENEIIAIWSKQVEYYPSILTKELYEKVHRIIIQQRELKPQEKGRCLFEKNEYRAYNMTLEAQEFRILTEVNNLKKIDPTIGSVDLCESERTSIVASLQLTSLRSSPKEIKFNKIRKIIGFSGKFNLEDEKRDSLKCNQVEYLFKSSKSQKLKRLWNEINTNSKKHIIDLLHSNKSDESVRQELESVIHDNEALEAILSINLNAGVSRLSFKAINKLLPYMRKGMGYHDACIMVYGSHTHRTEKAESLSIPYYGKILSESVIRGNADKDPNIDPEKYYGRISNPSVHVILNAIRSLLNAIMVKYGKIDTIVYETARELPLSVEQRSKLLKEQKNNQDANKKSKEHIEGLGLNPTFKNIIKHQLWIEQKGVCIYSGKRIGQSELFSDQTEVDHILPISRSLDDSRQNKVVCFRECNRDKENMTPFEYYGNKPEWSMENGIIARASLLPTAKQKRFLPDAMNNRSMEVARLLNDTKYVNKVISRYLSPYCNDIYSLKGKVTAILRRKWGLNSILSEDGEKDRNDYRHHSIDAFILASTSRGILQRVINEAKKINHNKIHKLIQFEIPLPLHQVRESINRIVVYQKPDHNKNGSLHDETLYGLMEENKEKDGNKKEQSREEEDNVINATNRVKIESIQMNEKSINRIINQKDKGALLEYMHELETEIKDEKEQSKKWKEFLIKYGEVNRIRRIKQITKLQPETVRVIQHSDSNGFTHKSLCKPIESYCMDIYSPTKGKDKGKWFHETIKLHDFKDKNFKPKWRESDATAKLIMRLHKRDHISMIIEGEILLFRVRFLKRNGAIGVVQNHLVEPVEKKGKGTKNQLSFIPSVIQKYDAVKVKIDPLGRVHGGHSRKKQEK